MDINQLITYQRLAREQSFSNTAHFLGISQPTVTLRLKKLEEEMGVQLVQRSGEHITLTEAGEEFLHYVNRTLRVYDAGKKKLSELRQKNVTTLKLASTSGKSGSMLPDFLNFWYNKYPDTVISLHSGTAKDVLYMVKDGVADAGILRGSVTDPAFRSAFLYDDPVHLIVSPNHRLVREKKPVSVRQLADEPLLFYNSNSVSQIVEKIFLQNGIIPRIKARLDNVATVKNMLASGESIAFLSCSSIHQDISAKKLIAVPVIEIRSLKLPSSLITLNCAASSCLSAAPLLEAFIRELTDYCRHIFAAKLCD